MQHRNDPKVLPSQKMKRSFGPRSGILSAAIALNEASMIHLARCRGSEGQTEGFPLGGNSLYGYYTLPASKPFSGELGICNARL